MRGPTPWSGPAAVLTAVEVVPVACERGRKMTKNDAKAVDSDDLIAIVGMAVRVPGAENLD